MVTKEALNMEKTDDDDKKTKFDHGRKVGAPKIQSSCVSLQYDLVLEWQVPDHVADSLNMLMNDK